MNIISDMRQLLDTAWRIVFVADDSFLYTNVWNWDIFIDWYDMYLQQAGNTHMTYSLVDQLQYCNTFPASQAAFSPWASTETDRTDKTTHNTIMVSYYSLCLRVLKHKDFIFLKLCQTFCVFSHQERAEEDEGDKVGVGKGAATLGFCVPWGRVAFLTTQASQHDLMPRFSSSAPAWGDTKRDTGWATKKPEACRVSGRVN